MSNNFDLGNPLLSEEKFTTSRSSARMTRTGTAAWTAIFLAVVIATGAFSWRTFMTEIGSFDLGTLERVVTGQNEKGKDIKETKVVDPKTRAVSEPPQFSTPKTNALMIFGALGAFVVGLLVIFNPRSAPIGGIVYAALEGLAVGAFSARFELIFPGITLQAASATVAVAVVMWLLFTFGIIKVTGGFVSFVLAMMLGILGLYLIDFGVSLFMGKGLDIVHGNGWGSILLSVVIVFIAALNFCIDYANIEEGIKDGAPKYMEAYSAFALLVTIIWCYLEIVRLIAKARSSDIRSRAWASVVGAFRSNKTPVHAT